MDEKKVREAIDELKSLICVRKRTLAALPTSARKNSLYNNEITALETAIEALEKQLPKKPKEDSAKFAAFYECPSCGDIDVYGQKNCDECGQKLDWTE